MDDGCIISLPYYGYNQNVQYNLIFKLIKNQAFPDK
jgi:hypothetical protein